MSSLFEDGLHINHDGYVRYDKLLKEYINNKKRKREYEKKNIKNSINDYRFTDDEVLFLWRFYHHLMDKNRCK